MDTQPSSGKKDTFRSEALAARRESINGEPAMAYPLSLSRLGWGAAAVAVAFVAFLVFADYTQYYRAAALVTPRSGLTVHVAGQAGTLYLAPDMAPGTRLREGALLGWVEAVAAVEVENSLTDAGLSHLSSKRDSLLRADRIADTSADAQLASIQSQSGLIGTQIGRLQRERALTEERLRLKRAELERNIALERSGYVSWQTVAGLRAEVAELESQTAGAERDMAALKQQEAALNQRAIDLRERTRAETERLRQEVAEVDNRIVTARANRRAELRAEKPFTVQAVHVESGNYVEIDTPVLTAMDPDERLLIRALVSARAVVGLRPGARVRVRYDAFPYHYYGSFEGKVFSVDRSPWQGAGTAAEPLYRVMVQPATQLIQTPQGARRLLPGMSAQVEVPMATRSLLQWILLPGRNY